MTQTEENNYIVFLCKNSIELPKSSYSFATGHKNGRCFLREKSCEIKAVDQQWLLASTLSIMGEPVQTKN